MQLSIDFSFCGKPTFSIFKYYRLVRVVCCTPEKDLFTTMLTKWKEKKRKKGKKPPSGCFICLVEEREETRLGGGIALFLTMKSESPFSFHGGKTKPPITFGFYFSFLFRYIFSYPCFFFPFE